MNNQTISRRLVSDDQRTPFTAKLFGFNFPMRLEPTIYDMAGRLASEYRGGYWDFYAISNNNPRRKHKTLDIYIKPTMARVLAGRR